MRRRGFLPIEMRFHAEIIRENQARSITSSAKKSKMRDGTEFAGN
jgi:hypothetical protein